MDRRDALRWIGLAAAAAAGGDWARGTSVMRWESRTIPSNGESLPLIGLGTWQTFDVGKSAQERAPLEEVLQAFAAAGGKLVDTSPMYGRAEEVLGDLTAKLGLRPKLFLATKVWTSGKQAGIEQMEASLRKLRAPSMDLVQVHNLLDVERHLATLKEWKAAGRVRYVGITHYTASAHDAVAKVLESHPVDFVQINYSVAERDAERRVLPVAKERGVAVLANRPFAGGDLLRRLRAKPLPSVAEELHCASWAPLLLKFVVGHPAVTCAIPATSKVAHLMENLGAAFRPLPDEKQRARIAAEIG